MLWESQDFNITTMSASDENVAVFGDFQSNSYSRQGTQLDFSILVKVIAQKLPLPSISRRQQRHGVQGSAKAPPGSFKPKEAENRSRFDAGQTNEEPIRIVSYMQVRRDRPWWTEQERKTQ